LPLNSDSAASRLRDIIDLPFTGTRIVERMPEEVWTHVPSALHRPLERRIKNAFDPRGIFNPGILGELQ
jgi:FAD/FMN-containing dehydrogenase